MILKLTRLMGALAAVAIAGGLLGGGVLAAAEPDRDDLRPPQVLPKGFESTDQLQPMWNGPKAGRYTPPGLSKAAGS
jgi:hypothetical protein